MAEITTYALPVYEAVVCGLTLSRLRQDESEEHDREKLRWSLDCEEKMRAALDLFDKGDFSGFPREDISQLASALAALVYTARRFVPLLRDSLGAMSEPYRAAEADVVVRTEELGARFEGIAEAWCMAADEAVVNEIREALSSATKRDEIAPWRNVLASVKD